MSPAGLDLRMRDEVMGACRKLHNVELDNLYSSPSISRVINTVWCGYESRGTRIWGWLLERTSNVNDRPILSPGRVLHKDYTRKRSVGKCVSKDWSPGRADRRYTASRKVTVTVRRSSGGQQFRSESSQSKAVREEGFGWRVTVSYCNWLWLRVSIHEGVNKSNHTIQTPLLLVTPVNMTILKCLWEMGSDRVIWTQFIWLRIGASRGLLCTR
jgi:hypothetical protein